MNFFCSSMFPFCWSVSLLPFLYTLHFSAFYSHQHFFPYSSACFSLMLLPLHHVFFFLLCHSPPANSSIFFSYITLLLSSLFVFLCLFLSTHCFTFLLTYHSFLLPLSFLLSFLSCTFISPFFNLLLH